MKRIVPVLSALLLTACASYTGVVPAGEGRFMLAKQQATGFPGLGNMKAELLQDASRHCDGMGKELKVLNASETQPPYVLGNYPRAELLFVCTPR